MNLAFFSVAFHNNYLLCNYKDITKELIFFLNYIFHQFINVLHLSSGRPIYTTLQEHGWILTNATIAKVSDLSFTMVVYEKNIWKHK